MIRILIADDHILIRTGFRKLIERENDMVLKGEASSASELFNLLPKVKADLVILDISLPDKNGLEVLKEIRNINTQIKILVLSMHPEERYALRAIKNGASGYVSKSSATVDLIDAIRKIMDGSIYMSKGLTKELINDLTIDSSKVPHKGLSDREFQVLVLLGKGKSVNAIAELLSLSIHTVNTYRRRILDKMNLKSNAELIRYAIQRNLVD
jgi:DNA-binding NarL/FixJ family response regulator